MRTKLMTSTIRPSDLLLLAARNEDDVSFIELWVCEEPEAGGPEGGGETEFNMYVHHGVMLPAFPSPWPGWTSTPRAPPRQQAPRQRVPVPRQRVPRQRGASWRWAR